MSPQRNGKPTETEPVVIGYCVYCRSRRQMQGAIQVCNRRGRYDLQGHCDICGRSIYRLGGWDTVTTATHDTPKPAECVVGDADAPPETAEPPQCVE